MKVNADKVECNLEDIPHESNNLPGYSNIEVPFGKDEVRPPKRLFLVPYLNVSTLQYVDIELFYYLKSKIAGLGVSKATHGKLHVLAESYMKNHLLTHISPDVLFEVQQHTVFAALVPLKTEIDALKLFAKKKNIRDIKRLSDFKQRGILYVSRWFGLRRKVMTIQDE